MSGPSVFTIIQPPAITSLVPSSRTAGATGFTLTVNGTTFDSGSTVQWNGAAIPTTFVSATQLTAQVSASLIASPGSVNVTVAPASGTVSAPAVFTILPAPVLTSINPTSAVSGSPQFSLVVTGANFTNTMTVLWNGSPLSTTFNSSTQLTATVPASLLIAGTAFITVTSADGVVTGSRPFTIFPRLVILTSSLPEGITGRLYSITLGAAGGVQPYNWTAQGLPPGYSLNSSTGTISGILQTPGSFSVNVTLTDASGQTATASYSLIVKQAEIPLEIITGSIPPGQASVPYGASFAARGGTSPYTFSMSNGSLPAGLTLAGDGALFGTPTTFGRFPFTYG